MSRISTLKCVAALAAIAFPAVPAQAESLVRLTGGFGLSYLHANEFVYSGGNRLSQLIWTSAHVPTASAELAVPLADGWYLGLSGRGALGGDGHMEDYDWTGTYFAGYGDDQWTHRSVHPDTRLQHYVSADLRIGRTLVETPELRGGLHAALGYTDVKWDGFGGSYTYSDTGFRADTGTFGPGRVISYHQSLPTLMLGADADWQRGGWSLSGTAQAGVSFAASSHDDHWLRTLTIDDKFGIAPAAAAKLQAGYAISDSAELTFDASAHGSFGLVGDATYAGSVNGFFPGAAGADFWAVTVGAGLKGSF